VSTTPSGSGRAPVNRRSTTSGSNARMMTEVLHQIVGLGQHPVGASNLAIANRLFVTERTVEALTNQIFGKLGLKADPTSNRRVLAVLAFLRSPVT
jgi:ATP/maltotriose-dependent transcriptional regulator MalT